MEGSYPIHMPEDSSPGHCFATFATTLSAIGIELGQYINGHMVAAEGPHWFEDLDNFRAQTSSKHQKAFSYFDFSWIAKESANNSDSPIRPYLPKNNPTFYKQLDNLRHARNRWYHDYNPHNVPELQKALQLAIGISAACGLELLDDLLEINKRVAAIAAGTYKSPTMKAAVPEVKTPEARPAAPIAQSAVGATWLGPLGKRKIELKPSGSLVDLEKQMNVTAELTPNQRDRFLKLWRIILEKGWLWVDEAGSVAAYVAGTARMIGFWGEGVEDSTRDPFAKFLLTDTYTFTDSGFCHRESGGVLDETHIGRVTKATLNRGREAVEVGEVLRLTWDGDLIFFGDAGSQYIGEVESNDWFAGHFLIPTETAE